ncbi:hypothetical protein [Streptomyces adelaidensis]|uniref:hypothetical protein n=1 Tax=Streptomyces adelaidensis TaxID=2796465 RepID=UPI0019054F25|nr:hypothetical protein [Streptomyces adelaidensis]
MRDQWRRRWCAVTVLVELGDFAVVADGDGAVAVGRLAADWGDVRQYLGVYLVSGPAQLGHGQA